MEPVGIWEGTESLLPTVYRSLPPERANALGILTGRSPAAFLGQERLALLAVAPDAEGRADGPLPPCHLLLLPGTHTALVRKCRAACVMSYGSSPKDSLTISSMERDHLVLSLQRELKTLTGGSIERQEVILPLGRLHSPMQALSWAGLLLVLGISPGELPRLAERAILPPLGKPGPRGPCRIHP